MKLNLGCGGVYKKGYTNVDAYNNTVADKIMSANNLSFEENSFEEIYMSQVIEHLGIINSIHCLSECYRILKPDKKLIIETPDIKKTFENYLKGGQEARKFSLPWIYGVDFPGMIHRFCFPDDLLEEILIDIGFTEIEKQYFSDDKYQPILKMVCKKPIDYNACQIITFYRKKLLENKLIDTENQIVSLEIEEFIDFISKNLSKYLKTNNIKEIETILYEGAVRSPIITIVFIELLLSKELLKRDEVDKFIDVLNHLSEIDYPSLLAKLMSQIDNFAGSQEELFMTIYEIGRTTFKKFLKYDKKTIIKSLKEKAMSSDFNVELDFFSKKLIVLEAEKFFQMGVKYFSSEEYKKAIIMFDSAISLNRDHIFSYWNLARLHKILKKQESSEKNYINALKIIESTLDNDEKIRFLLKNEMDSTEEKLYKDPITSF